MARNMFDEPLTEDCRVRLMALLDNPTIDTWEDAHSIILNSESRVATVWQAVCAIDPNYANIGRVTDLHGNIIKEWTRIPDRNLLLQAVAYATH